MQSGVIRRIPFKISLHFIAITHIILCLTTGCNNSSRIEGRLETAENLLDHAPCSALHILEDTLFLTIKNKKQRALHSRLYSKAPDKNYTDIRSAIGIYNPASDTTEIINNISAMADILLNNENIGETAEILQKCYNKYLSGNIPKSHFPIWSKIFYKQKDYSRSIYYLNEYLKILGDNNSRAKLGTFYSLYNIAAECGNYKEAIMWNERYRELKNRLDKEKEENHIKDIEAEYTRKHLVKSYNDLNRRHKTHKTVTMLIAMVLTCTIFATVITAKRRIKLANARKNSEIEFYKALVRTLKEHYTELENEIQALASVNSTSDNELFTQACIKRLDALKDLMDYAYISESTPEKFYKRFREYLNQCRQDESSFNDLQFIANKKYYGIIDYLKETFPNLTQTELNYCSMICLGFTTNAIRVMYGHKNSTSIYNKRSRIYKKTRCRPYPSRIIFIKNHKRTGPKRVMIFTPAGWYYILYLQHIDNQIIIIEGIMFFQFFEAD